MLSLNTNGLHSKEKRRAILKTCREGGYDVCFLQETHSTPSAEKIWQAEWGGPILFAHGASNARGVLILLKRDLDFKILEQQSDEDGRYVIAKLAVHQMTFLAVNIYSPTQDHQLDQVRLIDKLEEKIVCMDTDNILLGGDFNLCLNPKLDKTHQRESAQRSTYTDRMESLLDSLSLTDIWRDLNPNTRRYTFRRGKYASRLNYWFISEHLVTSQSKTDITSTPLSDHDIISLKIGPNKISKGPGLWRFNNLLLAQKDFITWIHTTITEVKETEEPSDPKTKWEWLKHKIAEQTRKYEKEEYRQERNHELQLYKRLQHISKSLDNLSDCSNNSNTPEGSTEAEFDLLSEKESIDREKQRIRA